MSAMFAMMTARRASPIRSMLHAAPKTAQAAARAFRATRMLAPPAAGEQYRHYKGNDYVVVGTALHTETQEVMVVYRAARPAHPPDHGPPGPWLFVRPIKMWRQRVQMDGDDLPRFRRCATAEPEESPSG